MRIGQQRSPALVLFLIFITCGIYYYYWIYAVSQEIQEYQGRSDVSPGMEVFLTLLTCGIWNVYWDYRVGKRLGEMCAQSGIPVTDNAVLFLVLDICGLGIITAMIEQDSLNKIWRAAANTASQNPYFYGGGEAGGDTWPPPPKNQ